MQGIKMILIKKGFAVAVLALLVGCSADHASDYGQRNNSQAATQAANSVAVDDTSIIPGKRVGPITSETTHADLIKMFGESNVKDRTDVSPFTPVETKVTYTRINLGAKRSFTVVWEDENRDRVAQVTDFGSEWKTPEGIGIGTSLQELQQKLGKFKLYGFGWDYAGFVPLEDTQLSKYQYLFSFSLAADNNAINKFTKQYEELYGDKKISSTHPNLKLLDVRVFQMTVKFDH